MVKSEIREYLKTQLDEAIAQVPSDNVDRLAMEDFVGIRAYPDKGEWQLGPFEKDDSMTFKLNAITDDPWDIGWKAGFIFNPSVIVENGKIFMFYRAAPKKETLCSRICLAIYEKGRGWTDYKENPVFFPFDDDEMLSVEDPKVYRYGNKFVMFYNGVHDTRGTEVGKYNAKSEKFKVGRVGTTIKYALSDDLYHWERKGVCVPLETSGHWAKGAVIPRDSQGTAVKINGFYMMYISEGCFGKQVVGYSPDMINWKFEYEEYLDATAYGHLCEVACSITAHNDRGDMILDFFYIDKNDRFKAAQALYNIKEPLKCLDIRHGGTLAWGGLVKYENRWLVAQGWNAKNYENEIYIYSTLQ